ncbi:MAG TPA: hypothetical protein VK718_00565 [Ferruginibacter sp.]|jgi:hypothetical protein|nr:hypothetical protein [Ferruginibacter sp.]
MALEEFENDKESNREKSRWQVRSVTNYIMGGLMIIAGCFFMFPIKYTERVVESYDPVMIKLFAVICWIYGAFRIYRGYNKNV